MEDARLAVETGVDGLDVVIGTSSFLREHSHGKDMAYITKTAIEVIEYIKSKGLEVRCKSTNLFFPSRARITHAIPKPPATSWTLEFHLGIDCTKDKVGAREMMSQDQRAMTMSAIGTAGEASNTEMTVPVGGYNQVRSILWFRHYISLGLPSKPSIEWG